MKLSELQEKGQEFKELVWAFIDENKLECPDVKESVNNMLDTIDSAIIETDEPQEE